MSGRKPLSQIETMPHETFNEITSFLSHSENNTLLTLSKEITVNYSKNKAYIIVEGVRIKKKLFDFLNKERIFTWEDEEEGTMTQTYRFLQVVKDDRTGHTKFEFSYLWALHRDYPAVAYEIITDPGAFSVLLQNHPEQCKKHAKSFTNSLLSGLACLLASCIAAAICVPIACLTTLAFWITFPISLGILSCHANIPFVPRMGGFGILGSPFAILVSIGNALYYGYHVPPSTQSIVTVMKASFKMVYEICFARYLAPLDEIFKDPWYVPLQSTETTLMEVALQYKSKLSRSINTANIIQKLNIEKALQAEQKNKPLLVEKGPCKNHPIKKCFVAPTPLPHRKDEQSLKTLRR